MLPKVRPTNYAYFTSEDWEPLVKTLVIDPSLHIPDTLLPDRVKKLPKKDRQNLLLSTTSPEGGIKAEVYLVSELCSGSLEGRASAGAVIQCTTDFGDISVKMKTTPTHSLPFFHLTATSLGGAIRLYLPRSFTGPIKIISCEVTFSPPFAESLITLSEISVELRKSEYMKTRQYFLGEVSKYSKWAPDDHGEAPQFDEVVAEASEDHVFVCFEDEDWPAPPQLVKKGGAPSPFKLMSINPASTRPFLPQMKNAPSNNAVNKYINL